MKRKRNLSLNCGKPKRNSISSGSSVSEGQESNEYKEKKLKTASDRQSNITVRLQNTDMLTKYRTKNQHIHIENSKSDSSFLENEINEEDELWICEIPNSTDVNELIGKSVKLGNKKFLIKTEQAELECVSSKFENIPGVYENVLSVAFQNNRSRFSMKNVKPVGRLIIHEKIAELEPSTNLTPSDQNESTLFPNISVVRHPLFGVHFKEKIEVNDRVRKKLTEAQTSSERIFDNVQVKLEIEESSKISHKVIEPPNRRAAIENSMYKTKKGNSHDDDLSRIKQIFEKTNHTDSTL